MTSKRVLVAHASRHGSTREVADEVASVLRGAGFTVDVMAAADVGHLRGFDAVVLGGALYLGRLHKDARRFLERHEDKLSVRPVAVFALGPRTLEAGEVASSRGQLEHALAKTPHIEPVSLAIFGGVIDPATHRFPFNRIPASDARDWAAIEDWAGELAERFAPAPAISAS